MMYGRNPVNMGGVTYERARILRTSQRLVRTNPVYQDLKETSLLAEIKQFFDTDNFGTERKEEIVAPKNQKLAMRLHSHGKNKNQNLKTTIQEKPTKDLNYQLEKDNEVAIQKYIDQGYVSKVMGEVSPFHTIEYTKARSDPGKYEWCLTLRSFLGESA